MKTWSMRAAAGVVMMAMAAPASAQAPAVAKTAPASSTAKTSWNDLPDRFQIDAGYFRLNAGGGTDVNFERDLGTPKTANTFWLDTTLRMGRRHQIKVGYINFTRTGEPLRLTRDFTWNDKVYTAGLTATGSLETGLFSTYYRFAIVKRDRFEFGPAAGLGYLKLTAAIGATGTFTKPDGQVSSVNYDDSGSLGVPTGALGAFFNAWLAKRVVLRGDFLYMMVKPGNWAAAVTDGRLGVDFYPWRHVGIGAQYKYNKYSYDRILTQAGLGGSVAYQGFQIYASFLF
jgi:hypothetical protein